MLYLISKNKGFKEEVKIMRKVKCLLIFLILLSFLPIVGADNISMEEYKLLVWSNFKSTYEDIQEVVSVIQENNPQYSRKDILESILLVYMKIKENGSNISLEEVMEGVVRFAKDNYLGIDYKDLLSAYISSKTN